MSDVMELVMYADDDRWLTDALETDPVAWPSWVAHGRSQRSRGSTGAVWSTSRTATGS